MQETSRWIRCSGNWCLELLRMEYSKEKRRGRYICWLQVGNRGLETQEGGSAFKVPTKVGQGGVAGNNSKIAGWNLRAPHNFPWRVALLRGWVQRMWVSHRLDWTANLNQRLETQGWDPHSYKSVEMTVRKGQGWLWGKRRKERSNKGTQEDRRKCAQRRALAYNLNRSGFCLKSLCHRPWEKIICGWCR